MLGMDNFLGKLAVANSQGFTLRFRGPSENEAVSALLGKKPQVKAGAGFGRGARVPHRIAYSARR